MNKWIMYIFVYLLLIIVVGYYCDIKVLIDDLTGDYQINVNNRIWLRSSYTGLYSFNQWFRTSDGSLRLIDKDLIEGNDSKLGQWNETILIYSFVDFNGEIRNVTGRIRQWKRIPAITFSFHSGTIDLNNTLLLDMDQVRTVFPSFHIEKIDDHDQRAYITFAGMMMGDLEKSAGIWDKKSRLPKGGMSGGPWILFNSSENGQGDSIILSPFSQFMSTSLSVNQNQLEYGYLGSIKSIPSQSINSLIIYYSSQGINHLFRQWGKTMQQVYSKTSKYRLNDLTINYLGYYTDNGAYYYYHTESQINYEQTIIQIKRNLSIPIHYIQLDSWWYYKGLADGLYQWTPRPQIFPHGLQQLSEQLNHLPLVLHNRYWSLDTIYAINYTFVFDNWNLKSLPLGNDSFWIDLFNKSSVEWNLILYEQDWMNHQTIDFLPTREEFSLGRQWLIEMGYAANLFNVNIQYCMSLPRHVLQSLEISRVTQGRVSDDYYVSIVHQIPQWKIGLSSLFAYSLGLAPFKDSFWSNEIEDGSPYKSKAKEILPDRQILIATLSTGPVAFADGINSVNEERLMRCCRKDGLIFKPSRPLTMIDLLISDWALNKGISQGELYSTQTILNNQIFSIIFASSMKQTYSLIPSMIDSPSGIVWSYDNPYQLFTFNQNHSLEISNEKCDDRTFCLWYSSPLFQFNDSLSTKYALMGEMNKWTFVSEQRFSSLITNSDHTQMTITIEGLTDELVDILVYHSQFQSIIHLTCHFSNDKYQMFIQINSTSVICL